MKWNIFKMIFMTGCLKASHCSTHLRVNNARSENHCFVPKNATLLRTRQRAVVPQEPSSCFLLWEAQRRLLLLLQRSDVLPQLAAASPWTRGVWAETTLSSALKPVCYFWTYSAWYESQKTQSITTVNDICQSRICQCATCCRCWFIDCLLNERKLSMWYAHSSSRSVTRIAEEIICSSSGSESEEKRSLGRHGSG